MNRISRSFFIFGCLNLALSIGLGASGAHALKAHLAASDPGGWFTIALTYHQIHSLGLTLVGLALVLFPSSRWFVCSGGLMVLGIALFCGGLYLLGLFGIRLFPGGIPAGGMAFILAWCLLAVGGWRLPAKASRDI